MKSVVAGLLALAIITRPDVDDGKYRELGAHPDYAGVCQVTLKDAAGGSGVVVAPRWVLTAAHVVVGREASLLRVRAGGRDHSVARIVVHPGYASAPRGFQRTASDHALIELATETDVTPARLAAGLPYPGTLATLVGYGVGGPSGKDLAGIRRAARNRIDQVGGWSG